MARTASQSGFEILDHPADMGFHAWANSLPELLDVCALALTSVLTDVERIKKLDALDVEVSGDDAEMLLFNWLSEILFLFDGEGKLFSSFEIVELSKMDEGFKLIAKLKGEPYSKTTHPVNTYIKAITLHQLKVEQKDSIFEAHVFLDI